MLKKFLLLSALGFIAMSAASQGTMTFTTSAEKGTAVRLLPNTVSATQPITIDWGNGVEMKYTVDPKQAAYNRWIEGSIEGGTITVKGNLTEFELSNAKLTTARIENMAALTSLELDDNEIVSFELANYAPLKTLRLSNNRLRNTPTESPTLSLEHAGGTLTSLYLSENTDLECLDMRHLEVLEYLYINDCPKFASIFICAPEEKHSTLRSINISNCNLSHFYPVNLPALTTLKLDHNNLMSGETDDSPFVLGEYPQLANLDVSSNKGIKSLDISKCTKLEQLYIDSCSFSNIDVSQAKDLITLNCAANKIRSLDLGNNLDITTLLVNGNPIAELDLSPFGKINTLNISDTQIAYIHLMNAYYLKDFRASNTNLAFVDFNGQQSNRMTRIDLRNNKKFTPESMTYTLMTLPVSGKAYSTNLWLEGSNAEHSNTAYATSADMQWVCDVTGDNTAVNSPLLITVTGATDTGENKTGTLDRLYPYFAYSLDYDLDVMQTQGGKFIICQWQPEYFQTIKSVSNSALKGVPVHIYPYPEEGKRFRSVTVNGEEIFSRWFIVSEDATIKVNFTNELSSIAFDVEKGQDFTFLVNPADNNGSVFVDWGTGARTEYDGQRKYETGYVQIGGTRIDGTAASERITVYGDIAAIDVSGFGDVAADFGLWDNHITGVDLTNCPDLRLFNIHWNPISTIDLSQNTALEVLDLGYTNLQSIDLSNNKSLIYIEAYSDGFDDPASGIRALEAIDVSNLPELLHLNLKNNKISSIDLSKNTNLYELNLNGNKLQDVDVSNNPKLVSLDLGRNGISVLDLKANTELTSLNMDNNNLSSIDLSANTKLTDLMVSNNNIHDLDLSMLKGLQRCYINGNGMNADEINDTYYRLPQRVDDGSGEGSGIGQLSYNLVVSQSGDKAENDCRRADSSIAEDRDWTPNILGTNGGSDFAYLDILSSPNGTFRLTDSKGNEYKHGSKVPKYETIAITATPDEGYVFESYSLNDDIPVNASSFEMPGIYTKLRVNFAKKGGVACTQADEVLIEAKEGAIEIHADNATAYVFRADGLEVANAAINGTARIEMQSGHYIVKVEHNGKSSVKTLIVK